jgi:uncharacterized protein
MRKIVIISDTHGNLEAVHNIIDYMRQHNLTESIHLGDDYTDADLLVESKLLLDRVPGTWSLEYRNPYIDNRKMIEIEGHKIFLTHTPDTHKNDLQDDPNPEHIIKNKNCDLFLFGHIHQPMNEIIDGLHYFNPGHCKLSCDRGHKQTFGILEIDKNNITCTHIDLPLS